MWKHALVVEDSPAIAKAAELVLRRAGWSVAHANGVCEAMQLLSRRRFAAAVVDLGLPDGCGIEVVRACAGGEPPTPVVVLTVASAWATVDAALRAGAAGYLLKEDLAHHLPRALDDVVRGGCPLSATVARHLVTAALHPANGCAPTASAREGTHEPVTARERDVLRWLAAGRSYDDIAQALTVSPNTVRTHVRALYRKLGVHNRTLAVQAAARLGLVAASPAVPPQR